MNITEKLQSLINAANETTSESASDITEAMQDLVDGYGGTPPTGKILITSTAETDVASYATAQVEDDNLIPENIVDGKTILGVEGTFGGIIPSGTVNLTDTSLTDVTEYETAQIVDANLVAENIAKDVTVLGITGTHEGGGMQGNKVSFYDEDNVIYQETTVRNGNAVGKPIWVNGTDVVVWKIGTTEVTFPYTPSGNISMFAEIIHSRLPAGYIELQYVTVPCSSTESALNGFFINVPFNTIVKAVMSINLSQNTGNNIVMCKYAGSSQSPFFYASAGEFINRNLSTFSANKSPNMGTMTEYEFSLSTAETTGIKVGGWNDTNWGKQNSFGEIKLYGSSDTLLADLVPCVAPDYEIGMYDIVNDLMISNIPKKCYVGDSPSNTGTLYAGPEVNGLSPDDALNMLLGGNV